MALCFFVIFQRYLSSWEMSAAQTIQWADVEEISRLTAGFAVQVGHHVAVVGLAVVEVHAVHLGLGTVPENRKRRFFLLDLLRMIEVEIVQRWSLAIYEGLVGRRCLCGNTYIKPCQDAANTWLSHPQIQWDVYYFHQSTGLTSDKALTPESVF